MSKNKIRRTTYCDKIDEKLNLHENDHKNLYLLRPNHIGDKTKYLNVLLIIKSYKNQLMKFQITQLKYALVLPIYIGATTILCAQNGDTRGAQVSTFKTNLTVNSTQDVESFRLNQENDQQQIIEQCLRFQPLLNKIPADVKDNMKTYFILNKALTIELSSHLKLEGMPIITISDDKISSTKSYYKFLYIKIEKNKAWVRYIFTYAKDNVKKTIPMSIEFTKNNSIWKESNYQILK